MRGSHFYFLTADWPATWRTPTVQTENMSEQVTKPVAHITASPVPLQAAAAANLAGAASEISKTPVRNVAMTEAVELSPQEFLLNPVNLSVLDATIRDNDFSKKKIYYS